MPNVVQDAVILANIYLMLKDRGRRGRRELGHLLARAACMRYVNDFSEKMIHALGLTDLPLRRYSR